MRAFYGCHNLTTISLPKVTTIERQAFTECSNLRTITFGSEISEFVDSSVESDKNVLFSNFDEINKDTKPYKPYTENVTLHLTNSKEYAKVKNGNEWRGYTWKEILKK